jgi:hypothetical protein
MKAVISHCIMHLLILLRWVTLFVSPPPFPSNEEESPPPSPPPPRDQHQRPIAIVQPLPPVFQPVFANQPMRIHHENIIWPGAADHPARRTCQLAGRVGHYRCSPGRPCLRPHPSAQIPAVQLPHSATNGFQSVHAKTILSFLGKSLGKILDGLPARLLPLPHINRGSNKRQENGHKRIGKEM